MKTKILTVIATIIGCLFAAFAVWLDHVKMSIAAAYPFVAGSLYSSPYFYWAIFAAVAFWSLAAFGFISHRKYRRDHAV